MNRHFTVAVFVVYQNKTLLHWHKKLAQWFPVGGHVDPGESLCEAAIRETKEESGLDVELYQARPLPFGVFGHIKTLVAPIHIQHEYMNDDHVHMDAIFYARAASAELHPMDGEAVQIGWYRAEELETLPLAVDVKAYAKEALELLRT